MRDLNTLRIDHLIFALLRQVTSWDSLDIFAQFRHLHPLMLSADLIYTLICRASGNLLLEVWLVLVYRLWVLLLRHLLCSSDCILKWRVLSDGRFRARQILLVCSKR